MKKRNTSFWVLTLLACLASYGAFAQTPVNHPFNFNAGTFFNSGAPGFFYNYYDNGGPSFNYSNNQCYLLNAITFAPSNATTHRTRVSFTSFSVESGWDPLYIFNSNVAGTNLVNGGGAAPIGVGGGCGAAPAGGWYANPGTIIANNGVAAVGTNASEALSFSFASDASVTLAGWAAVVDQVAKIQCALVQPANVTVNASTTGCPGPVSIAAPAQNPAGCITTFGLTFQYSVNGGPFQTVAYTSPLTISGLQLGSNVIVWRIVNPADGLVVSSVTQNVTVVDNVPPTITCPPNVTLNLGPGLCSTFYSYTVGLTDNCPFIVPQAPVQLPASFLPHGGGTVFSLQGNNAPGGYLFNLTNNGSNPLVITGFGIRYGDPAFGAVIPPKQVRVWTKPGTYVGSELNAAAWTLDGGAAKTITVIPPYFASGTGPLAQVPLSTSVTVAPGATRAFFIYGINACPIFNYFNNVGPQTNGPWTMQGGPIAFTDFPAASYFQLGAQSAPNIQVNFNAEIPAVPVQTAGLPSGAEFPIGVTTNCFLGTDVAGNTSTCCFTVTVNEFPNPSQALTCNNNVQISLDANCSAFVNADKVLEGGPYKCYDNYVVEVDKTLPFGNGPWIRVSQGPNFPGFGTPQPLGPDDVGKTYQVRVTDPASGNRCWGFITIEDKLPPVLSCPAAIIPCNIDPVALPEDICPQVVGSAKVLEQNVAFTNFWTGYMGNVENLSGAPLTVTSVKVQASLAGAPAGTYNLKAYMRVGTFVGNESSAAGWTLCGDVNVNITAGFPTVLLYDIPFTTQFTVPGGATAGFYIVANNGSGTTVRVVATLATTPTSDGTLRIVNNPGRWVNGLFGGVAFANENPKPQIAFTYKSSLKACVPLPNGLLNADVTRSGNNWIVRRGAGTPRMEACSDVTLSYTDSEVDQNCASGLTKRITRRWVARDASGNTATCNQQIDLVRPKLGDVVLPPNYDDIDQPSIPCTANAYPTPEWLQASGRQGFPLVFGLPNGCSIGWQASPDVKIDVCDGTYKIVRKWFIVDWCSGQSIEHNQIIKVADMQAPTLNCPANLTVGTDPFQCCATVDLPDVVVSDNCSRIKSVSAMVTTFDPQTNQQTGMFTIPGSAANFPGNNPWDPDTLAVFGKTPCLPLGTHTVVYMVEDDCGNTSTCSFRLTVRDLTPPNVSCVEFTVVSIGVDDPADCYGPAGFQGVPPALGPCEFAGVTWVKATTFNNGSYDNCSNLKFTVKRMAPYSDCINNLNAIRGTPNCASLFPSFPSEFERAISEGDSIKFYCCEVGTTQTVILTAYQLDDNGNFVLGQDGTPVRNECMVEVSVQDKIKPLCTPPANVSVSCENFDPSLSKYGLPTVVDNCCLDTTVSFLGQCGLTQTVNLALFDTLCNRGTITRTFRVTDCHGNTQTCSQRIFVSYTNNYFIRFPNDVVVTQCDGTGNYGEPTFFGKDCEALGVSYEDVVNTVVPEACFLIERNWRIINWCQYNPNQGCTVVPNPEPNAIKLNPANRPGPVVSPAGTPAPWNPTVVAITPGATPTNYSQFWSANANCYTYKQLIWVIDNQKPVIENCPQSPVEVCDVTNNDPLLWNAMYWWDASIGSHDLCEAPTDLSITASDLCSGDNLTIRYLLCLDLDGDGVHETVVSSPQTGLGGLGWNRVNYGNANNPNYSGGQAREFDFRPVPANQKYGFALQVTKSGGKVTGAVRWNTQQAQNTYVIPELPYGRHKIVWVVDDMCGNEQVCEYEFEVKDCKKPTIICKNIGVNIMPTKMITIGVGDVLQETYDNCTPSPLLVVAIRKAGQGTGFPLLPNGQPQTSVTFTCAELGEREVEVWSRDVAGNADFCVARVNVQDNMGNCSATSATVAGALQTEANLGLEDASVSLTGNGVTVTDETDQNGQFTLAGVPTPGDYVVTPLKDNDHLNGVSTFDLVLINKHILGLEPLNSPYKMIAADANNSRSITTFDIVELRKLILGIYTELPNNTSWRFVDKDFAFPDPQNPFKTLFPETKELKGLTASSLANNFVAVKVGDVNGNAVTSSLMSADDRTAGTLLFDVDDRVVKAGEVFTVTFKAAEVVQGYQFTLNHSGLELVNIEPLTEGMTLGHFGVFGEESAVTTSWDGEVPAKFALTFRAKTSGELSRLLGVSGRITKAEAYSKGSDRLAVAFRFNGAQGPTITGVGFELYQNQPNPWLSKTQIGFHLPEATEATLTIFDETGRVLFTQRGQYGKGYNAVTLDRAVLNTTGVLYYELKTSKDSATRKMIQTK